MHHPAGLVVRDALDPGVERDHAAAILEIAAQRRHELMAVDDAGFRRAQRGNAVERRLHGARRGAVDQLEVFDAVGGPLLEDCLHLADFGVLGGDDQLAALPVRHAVRGAELVEHAAAARAVMGAQRAGRIVHAAVDHLGVAGRDAVADAARRFRDDHLVALERGGARHREPDNACADHKNLHGGNSYSFDAALSRRGDECAMNIMRRKNIVASALRRLASRTNSRLARSFVGRGSV